MAVGAAGRWHDHPAGHTVSTWSLFSHAYARARCSLALCREDADRLGDAEVHGEIGLDVVVRLAAPGVTDHGHVHDGAGVRVGGVDVAARPGQRATLGLARAGCVLLAFTGWVCPGIWAAASVTASAPPAWPWT